MFIHHVISSRVVGAPLEFKCKRDGGYIYIRIRTITQDDYKPLCRGGKLIGMPIQWDGAKAPDFKRKCLAWYQQFIRHYKTNDVQWRPIP